MAFYRAGIPVHTLVSEFEPRRAAMSAGEYPIFTKTFGGRT
jgi:hypothetical protein